MLARTHTRIPPASRGGVDIRLPWWALVLPALVFVTLLILVLNPAAEPTGPSWPGVTRLVEWAQQLIAR